MKSFDNIYANVNATIKNFEIIYASENRGTNEK